MGTLLREKIEEAGKKGLIDPICTKYTQYSRQENRV